MIEPQKDALTQQERIEKFKFLLKNKIVLCTGDELVLQRMVNTGELVPVRIAMFVRLKDDADKVHLATATGIPLFEAQELYDYAQECAKSAYYKELDALLKQKAASAIIDADFSKN